MHGTISNWSRRRQTKASPCRFAVSGSGGSRVSLRIFRKCERDPGGPDEGSDLEMSRADAHALRDALDRILATTGGAQ